MTTSVFTLSVIYCSRKNRGTGEEMVTYVPEGQQQFIYQPGRPGPLTAEELGRNDPPKSGDTTGQPTGSLPYQSLHIWEQPLPDPGKEPGTTTMASGCYQGTFPTLPCHGTGTVGSGQGGSGSVGTNSTAERGWPGTHSYYDQEKGWISSAGKK